MLTDQEGQTYSTECTAALSMFEQSYHYTFCHSWSGTQLVM